MAKINPEEADLCCDSCEVHENLVKIVNETMPDETELYDLQNFSRYLVIPRGSRSCLSCLRQRYASATWQKHCT